MSEARKSVAIQVGDRPPSLELTPEIEDLTRWAAAVDDDTLFHLDPEAARGQGFDGLVVHGTFQAAQLARMVLAWLDSGAELIELACRYEAPAIAGRRLRCSGVVAAIDVVDGGSEIEFDLFVESPPGSRVTSGTARARTTHSRARDVVAGLASEEGRVWSSDRVGLMICCGDCEESHEVAPG